jgi:hypothetical protein
MDRRTPVHDSLDKFPRNLAVIYLLPGLITVLPHALARWEFTTLSRGFISIAAARMVTVD